MLMVFIHKAISYKLQMEIFMAWLIAVEQILMAPFLKLHQPGTFTVLRSLVSADGINPYGSLLQGTDGNFYGMAAGGGASSGGTVFKITAAGALTVLHALQTTTDGSSPRGSLITGTDGNYYGLTYTGGSNLSGTLFKITPAGVFTVLSQFNGATQGQCSL
jgi:uncharacterized repeat protein (TIGR03803 family)